MKKNIAHTINSFLEHKYFLCIMIFVAILFVTFFSISTSPLYIDEGKDSVIFKSMGLAITQGKVPYVDFFDHKGPVLYFINALGQWLIPGRMGIFLLQIIATSVSLVYLFKTARLFLNGVQSVCVMAVTLFLLGGLYQEGNQCEEWILAFVSPCLYLLLSDIVHGVLKHISPFHGMLYGICFGMTFFIRPNDALAILGGALLGAICYSWFVMNENGKRIIYDILAFIGGFVLICIPIFVYFSYHDALNDFIYGLFIYNSLYASGVLGMLLSYRKIAYLLVWILMWYLIWSSKYRTILYIIVPICVFQFLMMGTRVFPHYLINYIVLFLLLGVFLIKETETTSLFFHCIILFSIVLVGRINVFRYAEDGIIERVEMLISHDEKSRAFYAESEKLLNNVPQEMQDSIWNYNVTWREKYPSYSSIFFHHGITQCNKLLHYTMCYVSEQLKEDDDIQSYFPPYVVLTHSHDDDTIRQPSWAEFTEDYNYIYSNYEVVAKTDSLICDIELLKRK